MGGGGRARREKKRQTSVPARDCYRGRRARHGGKNVASYASFALVIAGLLGSREALAAAYVDGGDVSMDCDDCECTGSSDDGIITVFDNPYSGERVAEVDGDLSEILETACGMSLIAVGDNLYDLRGVELRARELQVVDMSSDDCTTKETPDSADCYAGSTSKTLSGGVEMDLDICLCSFKDDSVVYKASIKSSVTGTTSVTIEDGVEICLGNGFISYLVAATVDDETYYYNFDLAISGEDSSEDLSVSSAPPSSAEAFMCGGDDAETTPAPAAAAADDDDSDEVDREPSPSPTTVVSSSAAPMPVGLPTPATTIAPVGRVTVPPSAIETVGPVGVVLDTAAPAAGVAPPTGVPVAAPTTGKPSVAPVAGPVGGGGSVEPTVAPSSAAERPTETTNPPYSEDELEAEACTLPEAAPCTLAAALANTNVGIGVYYDRACAATSLSSSEESLTGCGMGGVDVCRTCIFNTPLFNASPEGAGDDAPDYVDCPCCVMDEYVRHTAADEDGPRCENPSPAPSRGSVGGAGTTPTDPSGFHDRPRNLGGSEAVAVAALGLLGVLTFFPFCGK